MADNVGFSNGDFAKYKELILYRFDELEKRLDRIESHIDSLNENITSVKVKVAGIAAIVGLLAGVIPQIVQHLTR